MPSNPKVNISSSVYEQIKKLPEAARKAALIKEVTKAAKEAGYTQADLLKDTTHISFKINTRFGTVEKSSAKSKVIKDMVTDVEAKKEEELKAKQEQEEKEAEEREAEENENEKEKDKDKDKEDDKDEDEKDKDKKKEKDKDKDENQQEQEEDKPKENPNKLKIAITDRLLDEISGLGAEEAKNVIRANIEGQANAQGFDMTKLHKPCGGLSINDADKNQTANATTPNGSTMLDNLIEVVYAACKGYGVEEQAQACEAGDSQHMSDAGMMGEAVNDIQGMVNPTPEQEVELQRGALAPDSFGPSGLRKY